MIEFKDVFEMDLGYSYDHTKEGYLVLKGYVTNRRIQWLKMQMFRLQDFGFQGYPVRIAQLQVSTLTDPNERGAVCQLVCQYMTDDDVLLPGSGSGAVSEHGHTVVTNDPDPDAFESTVDYCLSMMKRAAEEEDYESAAEWKQKAEAAVGATDD